MVGLMAGILNCASALRYDEAWRPGGYELAFNEVVNYSRLAKTRATEADMVVVQDRKLELARRGETEEGPASSEVRTGPPAVFDMS